jgi:fatty-acyl-CoA synthase
MATGIVKGFQSTSGDDFQLNTITFLKHAAQNFPEVEIVSRNFDGTPFRYTYHGAYQRVKKLAGALKRIGIVAGDRVGVMEWNTHRFFELYFAVSGLGAVLVQLNPRISGVDRAYVINHSGARFTFITELMIPLIEQVASELSQVEGYCIISDRNPVEITTGLSPIHDYEQLLAKEAAEFDWPMIDETSAFSACYTSGTTGKPKGVFYSHRCIYLHTMAAASNFSITMNDVVMQTVPMFHCHGWGFFFLAAMAGAKLVIPGIYTADNVGSLVDQMISEKVTVSCGAPAIFMPMLEYIRSLPEKPDFTGLRMASGATEPSLSLMKGFQELGGVEIIHAYGATETAPVATANFLKPSLSGMSQEEKWELKKKQGIPVAGLDFKVVDAERNEVPHDGVSVGEILIRGPWVTRAYYNDPRNAESFVDGYWKSGDAGTIDKNGYLKISDRFKDLIKSGGEWISSIDLENAIMAHPAVLEAAVAGLPHPKWQERPLALVVLRKNMEGKTDKKDILEYIGPKFARWQLPDDVLFVAEIPKTSVGKFSKKDIRLHYHEFYKNKI